MNSANTHDKLYLPQIIGVTGRKHNGKDTLGNFFVENHGYKRIAFADALKEACEKIFGFDNDQLYGDKKETLDEYWEVTPRTVLQYVGTELFRNQLEPIMPKIGKDIWLKVVEKKILDNLKSNPSQKFIITDVRFENECNLIEKMGGVTIRVKRDSANNVKDCHPSEIDIEKLKVNAEILNNGTKEELYQDAIDFLKCNVV